MKLAPGERAILSYYNTSEMARQSVQELRAAGFNSIDIDRLPKHNFTRESIPALTNNAFNEGTLVDDSSERAYSESWDSFITNWNPTGIIEDYTPMVTLIVNQNNVDQALSIVKKYASVVN